MTTPTPNRWSAETEELVARQIWPTGLNGRTPTDAPASVLRALADAGHLMPPGGETRQEIEVQTAGLRYPCADMPMAWREFGEMKAKGYDAHIVERTVHLGPWREVTDDPA